MTQEASICGSDGSDEWEFNLGETVSLLWLPEVCGRVIGRSESIHEDQQYLVEYATLDGDLLRRWVYGVAIDAVGTKH